MFIDINRIQGYKYTYLIQVIKVVRFQRLCMGSLDADGVQLLHAAARFLLEQYRYALVFKLYCSMTPQ